MLIPLTILTHGDMDTPTEPGSIEEQSVTNNEINSLLTVTYDWKITPELDLNVLYGNELVDNSSKYKDNLGNNFNFPGWNHIANASV